MNTHTHTHLDGCRAFATLGQIGRLLVAIDAEAVAASTSNAEI